MVDRTKDERIIYLYSPLTHEITVNYLDDNDKSHELRVSPMEVTSYPSYLARLVRQAILDALVNERHKGFATPEQKKLLMAEIDVVL